jgi:ubiquinone/menaquinone biosynthesis C-methylase UbiE
VKADEYEIMFRVEDHHWWYVGLRAMLDAFWQRHVREERPVVIDVGCGTGATLDALRDVATATGIDAAPQAIRLCRMRGLTATAAASAEALPFRDASFDVAISCDVLCHQSIADKSVPLREVRRVLKPGGLLLLNLPAYQWLHSSHDEHVHTNRRFTRAEVRALLENVGFEVVYSTYWNSLLLPAIVMVRLWRKAIPRPVSDLDGDGTSVLSSIFAACLAVERVLLSYVPLPFGLSTFAIARKIPSGHEGPQ